MCHCLCLVGCWNPGHFRCATVVAVVVADYHGKVKLVFEEFRLDFLLQRLHA